jgi:hypothetical protein
LVTNEKELHKQLARLKIAETDFPSWLTNHEVACVYTFEQQSTGQLCCFVCVGKEFKKTSRAEQAGTIAHEAVHVWQHHRKWMGEKKPSREFEAYSIESITTTLLTALWKKKKGK